MAEFAYIHIAVMAIVMQLLVKILAIKMLAVIWMLYISAWNKVVGLPIIYRTVLYIINSKQDTVEKP